ncbi:unnamed protein product [Durusdinium trenchii]|uniref:Ubiquitin-like domain-containing protein n=1 Tax=Durusdinium trenchii TaxID=1381693 RepID=A0ABP0HW89_9DINO
MDPITLHFNIFQAGTPSQGRQSFQVEDPASATVGALKRQLFADALEAQRSVRFIASGRILEDTSSLDKCNLGPESHICVSISDKSDAVRSMPSPPVEKQVKTAQMERDSDLQAWQVWTRCASFLAMAGSAMVFPYALQKHRHLSSNTHLFVCIAAAVWVYLLIFHTVPDAVQIILAAARWALSGKSEEIRSDTVESERHCARPSALSTTLSARRPKAEDTS